MATLGNQFIIETDQNSLKNFLNHIIQSPNQQDIIQKYYLSKLLGYDYIISYKPGK